VAYIDDDDEDDPSVPVYQTMPYVCGKVLLASVLDSLVAAVSTSLLRSINSVLVLFLHHSCACYDIKRYFNLAFLPA